MSRGPAALSTLLVLAHQRQNSLTAEVARLFRQTLEHDHHEVEIADLVAEAFNPVMAAADEPQWHNQGGLDRNSLPDDIRREINRIERHSSAVLVFPVYWWSMPAILKGWIDRVWTYGFAYGGDQQIPLRRVWMIGIAGCDAPVYADNQYQDAMETQLTNGILGYCGVPERRLILLYDSMNLEKTGELLSEVESLCQQFIA